MPNKMKTHRPPGALMRPHLHQHERRLTTTERGYGSTWQRLRLLVLRGEPLCRHCGAAATDVDHIVPKRAGGPDTMENLQPLCHSCHSIKTGKEKAHADR